MTTALRSTAILILTILPFTNAYAQDTTTTNFFDQIKAYDLSTILTADSILTEDREGDKEKIKRSEILGFIGDDYQRFFIHLVSVIQNPVNPYEYLVYGKTRVKETISTFQGTITVRKAGIYKSGDIPTYKQGFVTCDVILYEDKKHPSTGFIKGKLKTALIIDNKGRFRYDALMLIADGFSNNQFVGSWTSYKTNLSKKCNWGDFRIPGCGDLDIGAGEFSVDDKYVKSGWSNYRQAYSHEDTNSMASKQARQKEDEQWWK
ncbi:hypothetical protein GZH53_01570 [Flavihumibacter sp. R14]|nr:hypothetical protein [Flavihumibacter soli]